MRSGSERSEMEPEWPKFHLCLRGGAIHELWEPRPCCSRDRKDDARESQTLSSAIKVHSWSQLYISYSMLYTEYCALYIISVFILE